MLQHGKLVSDILKQTEWGIATTATTLSSLSWVG